MPNGGDVVCCADCRHAKKAPDTHTIKCTKHNIKVTSAFHMFCKNLTLPAQRDSEYFALEAKVLEGVMYTWAGFYTHQEYSFAAIETYAAWSDEEKEKHFREKQDDWESKYRSIYGDDAWF